MNLYRKSDKYGEFLVHFQDGFFERKPFFSFVISMYNSEGTICRCIESMLAQNYQDFEIILVDDGSNDNSLKLAFSYLEKDNRILIIEQDNMGLTKSLNRAINLSRGDYIVRQDSDDESTYDRLEEIKKICGKENSKVIFSSVKEVSESGMVRIVPSNRYFIKNKFSYNVLKYSNVIVHGSLVIDTILAKNELYDDAFIYSQDYELLTRLLSHGHLFSFVNKELYILNRSDGSISNTKKKEQQNFAKLACEKNLGSSKYFIQNKNIIVRYILKIIREMDLMYWHFMRR